MFHIIPPPPSVPRRGNLAVTELRSHYHLLWPIIFFTCRGLSGVGRDSVVGMATRYRLNGPGIEFRWGREFSHPSNRPWGHPASYTIGTRSFPGVEQEGHGVDYPTTSSSEVKERVELYVYSPSGPSWSALWWTLNLGGFSEYGKRS